MIRTGHHTPWGPAQDVIPVANGEGIAFVSTASHGGYYVPAAMLAKMPLAARLASFNGQGLVGWFEEDCDWCLVVLSFPDLFSKDNHDAAEQALRGNLLMAKSWNEPGRVAEMRAALVALGVETFAGSEQVEA
jgi:hypothetical protein